MPRRDRHAHRISLPDFSRSLARQIEGVSLISFDVFGTLLRPRNDDRRKEADSNPDAWAIVPGITDLLEQLRPKEISLVAVSTHRVETDTLRRILEAKKLIDFFDAVLSLADEAGDTPATERLNSILGDHSGNPESTLHIGTEIPSETSPSFEPPIRTVFLRHPGERKRRALLRRYSDLARRNRYWRGRHLLQIAQGDAPDLSHASFHYRYGREILGPIFCSYILALLERLEEIEPDCIYFVARDGYLLQELYRQMAPALGHEERPHRYLYLSRRTAFAGSIRDGLSLEKAQTVLKGEAPLQLVSVLEAFGLDAGEWQAEAQRHGWSDIQEPLSSIEDPRLVRFLADPSVQERISAEGQAACRHLELYLEQQDFFKQKKVALVDIGWNGNSQLALSRLSPWRASQNRMFGLYFAFVAEQSQEFGGRNQAEGLWYDHGEGPSPARVVTEYEEIFEEASRAAHATTLRYVENDSRIEPELKPDDAPDRAQELACNPLIAELQRGILDFASDFSTAIALTGYTAHDIKPFMGSLAERAIAFPSRLEVGEVTRLAHANDLGQNTLMDYSNLQRPRVPSPRKGRFISEMRASHWRYAMLSGPLRVAYHLYRGIKQA
ncbi:MAG: HAD hydrolase-like protein [Myxococcota bacterium]|nr:HAD hydrolase-like protein [Myxococcota bacterium]